LYQCGVVIFVKYFLIQCFKLHFIRNDNGLVHERNCDFSFVVNVVLFTWKGTIYSFNIKLFSIFNDRIRICCVLYMILYHSKSKSDLNNSLSWKYICFK